MGFDEGLAVGESVVGLDVVGVVVGLEVVVVEVVVVEVGMDVVQVVSAHQFSPPLVDTGEALYVQPELRKMFVALE